MITTRALTTADRDEMFALDHYAFVGDPTRVPAEHTAESVDWSRAVGAEHPDAPGRLAGIFSAYDLRLRVPGGVGEESGTRSVPLEGLTWVAVHPDLRRRGVLTAMMRTFLERAREQGAAMAGLHASEPGIYGRFGFGVASHDVRYELARGTRLEAPPAVAGLADATTTHLVLDLDDEEIARRIHAVDQADPTPGFVVVPEPVVRRRLRDVPSARIGREPLRGIVARRHGRDVGWVVFDRTVEWKDANPDGRLQVQHLAAVDTGALLALGRRLVDVDLMSTTAVPCRGVDDPLLQWAGDVRRRALRIADALWLRPVDVGAMLEARGYAGAGDVRFAVTDPTCPWNTGTWHLEVDEVGRARCGRTDAEADLDLDVRVLGEVFLGLVGARALAAAGRVEERARGAVAELDRLFHAGIRPVGGTGF